MKTERSTPSACGRGPGGGGVLSSRAPFFMTRRPFLPELSLVAVLVILPFILPHIGGSFDMMERMLDWGILGLGFDLLFGWTGLLSFGQAAFYGTGGFVAAYLLLNNIIASVWIALAIGTIAAGMFGVVVGWLAVRRIGIYFAMITLAFGQMSYFLENSPLSDYTGGENGLPGVPVPRLGLGDFAVRLEPGLPMYWYAGGVLLGRLLHRPPYHPLAVRRGAARDQGEHARAPPCWVTLCRATNSRCSSSPRCMPVWPAACLACCRATCRPTRSMLDTSGQLVVQTVIGGVGTLDRSTRRRRHLAVAARQPASDPRRRGAVEADSGRDLRGAGDRAAPRHLRRDPPLVGAAPHEPAGRPGGRKRAAGDPCCPGHGR